MIRRALFLAAALLGASALAQDASEAPFMFDSLPPAGATQQSRDGGQMAQALAMFGREDRIVAMRNAPLPAPCKLADGETVSLVVERARTAQIVMINEAHDSPRDRALIADVARALSALGYGTYAAETLRTNATEAVSSYPRLDDGYYSREPAFGQLLKTVRPIYPRIVAYEDTRPRTAGLDFADAVNRREAGQASNLINATVREERDQKVLVHVGYSHNRESVDRSEGREILWLAHRFREITGIDPLTIDQTTYVSDRTGVCASNADGSALPTDRDIYVAHPPLAFERGRPTWRLARGERFAEIPQALKRLDERVIYEARYANEPDDAVPADRLLVDPGEDIPLLLAPGRYRVRAWTEAGAWTASMPLTVADPTVRAPQKAQPKARPNSSRRKKR